MTDPNNPSAPQPPAYQPPAYPTSSSDASYGNPNAPIPGKTLGIVAFVLSFFAQLVALVLGIVALVQSKKAGHKNGFALAAIIISSVLMVIGVVVAIVLFTVFGNMANEIYQTCVVEGADTVTVWGQTQPCSSARY
ncbi:hypothetical protein CBF90_13055 [Microbacterium sp. AISO3]|jgi:hypothetical protein|uniref:DUF4190 domain-containing protein n=2 Tax=Microbacterium TaxID=33882 RepID=A0ABU1I4Y6_9MICO|nr:MULTISPECIES: DUF4190 domain-containing protein [Microbacterium]APF33823.1 hypothetical protein BO218_06130 [Microbacterium paludicola]MDR6168952.1 hypothetical protein [Microbacterium paludicola]OAZ39084.1 hypothetical protein A9Z40_10390 [Microbacterium arborescens]OWP21097.1 hypothetical protein CBF90_13055 [Microbacterium sp. AISO3]POX67514.1 DUF4190 domain-containing protein [Microbacterium sp. Ru50]